jgi:hypothetical protein
VLLLLREDQLVVEADLERPLTRGDQLDAVDRILELGEDGVRQTDGPGTIVSSGAELDSDSHGRSLREDLSYVMSCMRLMTTHHQEHDVVKEARWK